MKLPIAFPFAPMEAKIAAEIPSERGWPYEPKWDGFRCIALRDGQTVELQSKAGQSLTRYFPEIVAALNAVEPRAVSFSMENSSFRWMGGFRSTIFYREFTLPRAV